MSDNAVHNRMRFRFTLANIFLLMLFLCLLLSLFLAYRNLEPSRFQLSGEPEVVISGPKALNNSQRIQTSPNKTSIELSAKPPPQFTVTLNAEFIFNKPGETTFTHAELPISLDYQSSKLTFSESQPNYTATSPGRRSTPTMRYYCVDGRTSNSELSRTIDFYFFENDGYVFGPYSHKLEIVVVDDPQ
jgi:hypothetical protein